MKTCVGCGCSVRDNLNECPLCGSKAFANGGIPVSYSSAAHNPAPVAQTASSGQMRAHAGGSGPVSMNSLIAQAGSSGPVSMNSLTAQAGGSGPVSVNDLIARTGGSGPVGIEAVLGAVDAGQNASPILSVQEQQTASLLHFAEAKAADGGLRVLSSAPSLPSELTIPARYRGRPVTEISPSAFAGARIVSVHIPETVKSIGERAFENCRALASVTGCAGLRAIGRRAFAGCYHLSRFELPAQPVHAQYDSFAGCFDAGMQIESRLVLEGEEWG